MSSPATVVPEPVGSKSPMGSKSTGRDPQLNAAIVSALHASGKRGESPESTGSFAVAGLLGKDLLSAV